MTSDQVHVDAFARIVLVEERPKTWAVRCVLLEPATAFVERDGEPFGLEIVSGAIDFEVVRSSQPRPPAVGVVSRFKAVFGRETFHA